MRDKLTATVATNAKPQAKPYEIADIEMRGLLLRVQPSGVKSWIVTWGRGKRKTLGRFPVITVAAARVQALKALAESASHGAPLAVIDAKAPKPTTLGDYMANRYGPHLAATAKAGKATAAAIQAVFGGWYEKRLDKITLADWDTLKAERLKSKIQPATINRDLDRMKAALSQAVAWGLVPANPLASAKRIKRGIERRVRYLKPNEAKALRAALDAREARRKAERLSWERWRKERGREPLGAFHGYTDHLAPMVLLALNTGLRRGELTQITWGDVDLRAKVLTVRAGYAKSGKERHVPLNKEALAVLKQWHKSRPEGRLFPVAQINTAWERLMTDAKITNFRFHDCRHDFASRLVMAGVSLAVVRDLLGHGSIEMTERYAHLAPEQGARAVELLTP